MLPWPIRFLVAFVVLGGFLGVGVAGLFLPDRLRTCIIHSYSKQPCDSPTWQKLMLSIIESDYYEINARLVGLSCLIAFIVTLWALFK